MKPVLQIVDELAALDGVAAVTLAVRNDGKRFAGLSFVGGDGNALFSDLFGTFEDALADVNKKLLAANGRCIMLNVPQGTKGVVA